MNRLDARLSDVLEPVRDIAVGEILETMARSLGDGLDVRAEPKCRDTAGSVTREGKLALPRRGDLLILREGNDGLIRRVESDHVLRFEPVTLVEPEGFVCVISPFRWDAMQVLCERGENEGGWTPNWGPVRRWFLEWFQSRYSAEAPDLDGAVHALNGPEDRASGWLFQIDLGSAPVETLSDMIGAFAETGLPRIRIGRNVIA
ncbi:MAG: hypothetical protein AAF577_02445 [Pseudomonadota bacterium]